jgi:phage-related tail protein
VSDLSRLRARLARIERSGKRLKAELAEAREDLDADPVNFTRAQERRLGYLDKLIHEQRALWTMTRDKLEREERRLIEQGDAFLRFT